MDVYIYQTHQTVYFRCVLLFVDHKSIKTIFFKEGLFKRGLPFYKEADKLCLSRELGLKMQ